MRSYHSSLTMLNIERQVELTAINSAPARRVSIDGHIFYEDNVGIIHRTIPTDCRSTRSSTHLGTGLEQKGTTTIPNFCRKTR